MLRLDMYKIYKEMSKKGWTKAELSRKSGISKQMIQYIFESESVRQIHKIAKAFGVNVKDLIK